MKKNDPLLVGITGGIGSGKTLICKVFQVLGLPVYDADTHTRWLMEFDPDLQKAVINSFGGESYKSGKLNREYLAKMVFPNPEKLQVLNSITHPAVAIHFKKWVSEHHNFPYLIKEAALLIESGSYKSLDQLILVTAPEEVRIERILKRDPHRNKEAILEIFTRQLSDPEKRNHCQYEILNDDTTPVLSQVLELHHKFLLRLSDQNSV